MSEESKGWGTTKPFQDLMKAFADKAFDGDYSKASVYKKACVEMKELGEAIVEKQSGDDIGLEIADVILALLLLGDMHERDIGVLMRLKINQLSDRRWKKLDDGTWQHMEGEDAEEVSGEEGLDTIPGEAGEAGLSVPDLRSEGGARDTLF